jgi:hypothetical protein
MVKYTINCVKFYYPAVSLFLNMPTSSSAKANVLDKHKNYPAENKQKTKYKSEYAYRICMLIGRRNQHPLHFRCNKHC